MFRFILTLLALTATLPAAAPNIVLVTLDTTRAGHLSLYGYAEKTSPNLDTAAKGGRVFTRAYSIVPLTFPAHAVLLSGRTPFETQIFLNGQAFTPEPDYLPSLLKKKGYATAAFLSSAILDGNFGLAADFDTYADMTDLPKLEGAPRVERSAADTTALALGWLKKARKPFFLWVHFFDPHTPYTPPKPFADRFKLPYDGEIATMDASLGNLLKTLPKETFVLIVGDHGEMLGEHGEDEHGVLLHQGAVHIPLVLMGPGVPPGMAEGPVSLLDVYPTLLEAAGVKAPEGLQGQSLLSPADPARPILASSLYGREVLGFLPSLAAVQSDFKLLDYGGKDHQLFDLAKDPKESDNLFSAQRRKVREMKKLTDTVKFPETLAITIRDEDQKKLTALGYSAPKKTERLVHPEEGLKYERVFTKAKTLIEEGKTEDAITLLANLLATAPQHTEARSTLGRLYMKLGLHQEAREVFTQMVNRNTADPRTHLQLAETLAAQGEMERAVQEYRIALTLDPRLSEPYAALARVYYHGRDYAALEALRDQAKPYSIDSAELTAYLGYMAVDRKQADEAERLFQDARELAPSSPLVLKGLATVRKMKGDKAGSLALWKEVLGPAPHDPEANYMAGMLTLQTGGSREEALGFLRQAQERCLGPKLCGLVKKAIAEAEKK
jgi:arylsulfatase A-like enzyme/cytochrome c-type biogenesis protein CcmH/NrfG